MHCWLAQELSYNTLETRPEMHCIPNCPTRVLSASSADTGNGGHACRSSPAFCSRWAPRCWPPNGTTTSNRRSCYCSKRWLTVGPLCAPGRFGRCVTWCARTPRAGTSGCMGSWRCSACWRPTATWRSGWVVHGVGMWWITVCSLRDNARHTAAICRISKSKKHVRVNDLDHKSWAVCRKWFLGCRIVVIKEYVRSCWFRAFQAA